MVFMLLINHLWLTPNVLAQIGNFYHAWSARGEHAVRAIRTNNCITTQVSSHVFTFGVQRKLYTSECRVWVNFFWIISCFVDDDFNSIPKRKKISYFPKRSAWAHWGGYKRNGADFLLFLRQFSNRRTLRSSNPESCLIYKKNENCFEGKIVEFSTENK